MRRDLDFAVRVTATGDESVDAIQEVVAGAITSLLREGPLYVGKTRQAVAGHEAATVEISAFAQRSDEEPD